MGASKATSTRDGSLSLKSSLTYGAASSSNLYYLFFGVTFTFFPLIFFQTIILALTVIFIIGFIRTRNKMFPDKKVVIKEVVGLCLPIIFSVLIGSLTVSLDFDENGLNSIINKNLLFGFINLSIIMLFVIKVSSRTKKWYSKSS